MFSYARNSNADGGGYQVVRRVRSGSVTVDGMIVDYKMPFPGFKQSGMGREGGIEGLQTTSILRPSISDVSLHGLILLLYW